MNAKCRHTVRLPTSSEDRFAERLALFALATGREGGKQLLEGLADSIKANAVAVFESAQAADPVARRGRLARELGTRGDAAERLERKARAAAAELRAAMRQVAPAYLREALPSDGQDHRLEPGTQAFAARLVREALG